MKETLIGPFTTNCLLVQGYMVISLVLKSHPAVVCFIAFSFISWLLLNLDCGFNRKLETSMSCFVSVYFFELLCVLFTAWMYVTETGL